MAAGILGKAEGDGEREHPAGSRQPQQHGERRGRGEEQRHAAGHRRHDERDQPAVPPRLDQEGLGDPIEPGEEIAETEPESDRAPRISASARGRACSRVAAVEQPDERAEGEEQHRPGMDGREGEHRERAQRGRRTARGARLRRPATQVAARGHRQRVAGRVPRAASGSARRGSHQPASVGLHASLSASRRRLGGT